MPDAAAPARDTCRLGEAARRARVTPATLHYYLMCGVVRPAARSEGDQRLFNDDAIRRIRLVRLLNATGYPLREIRQIFAGRLAGPTPDAPRTRARQTRP